MELVGEQVQPLVTITMAIRGKPTWLREALESVRGQTFSSWRFVGFLDGPNPEAQKIIEDFGDKFLFMKSSNHNGVSRARNEIIRHTDSRYVANLDYDDIWPKEHLETLVEHLETDLSIVLIGSSAREMDETGRPTGKYRRASSVFLRSQLLFRNCFVHSSVVFRREAALASGLYNEQISIAEDYDFVMRLATVGKIKNLPNHSIAYRMHGNQSSSVAPNHLEVGFIGVSRKLLAVSIGAPPAIAGLAHRTWLLRNRARSRE